MKCSTWKRLIAIPGAMIVVAGCSSANPASSENRAEEEEPITLRVGSGVASTHIINEAYFKPWMEAVEEETDGQVDFEAHYGGSLVSAGREYEALDSGLVDIALPMFQLYDPIRFPLSEVSMLPLLESDVNIATKAYEELVLGDYTFENGESFYEMEHGSKDLKQWTSPTTEGYKFSYANLSQPETVEEFTNVTFRSSGRVSEIFSENLGINSVSIPATEIYDALSRGSIDGLYFSIPDWPSYGIGGLFNYTVTEGVNLGHYSHTFGMTQQTWEELPEEVQNIMDEQASKLLDAEETYDIYDVRREDALSSMEENGGMVEAMEEQPEEIQEAVDDAIVKTWEDWIEINEEKGFPGRETALLWRDLVIKHGGSVPDEIEEME